ALYCSDRRGAWSPPRGNVRARRRRRDDNSEAPMMTTAGTAGRALELRGVEKRFGATPIIRGVSLDVPHGERHAIIGPNGAGKSTLFNLISGRFAPPRGSILFDGEEIAGARPYAINRRGLARSFQVTNI